MKLTINRHTPEEIEKAAADLEERGFKRKSGVVKVKDTKRIFGKDREDKNRFLEEYSLESYIMEFEAPEEKPENVIDPAHYYKMLAANFQSRLDERVKEAEELQEEVKRLCRVAADLREESMRKDEYIRLLERNQNSGVKVIERGNRKLYEGSFFWNGRSIHIGEFESRKEAVQAVKEAKRNICL